jgi:hypothetical protein
MKLIFLTLTLISLTGCFSLSKDSPELLPKQEDAKGESGSISQPYLFRLFGADQPFLALYNTESGSLSHIYKAQASNKGDDFWQHVEEDSRMTRESRYFAASSAINPGAFIKDPQTGKIGASFRADIFRGDPSKRSLVGRSILFNVIDVVFHSETKLPQATTHIFVAATKEFHAIPLKSNADLLSFTYVEGLPKGQPEKGWLAIELKKGEGVPASTAMGCVGNYSGKILIANSTEEPEINAICDRQGQAGPG